MKRTALLLTLLLILHITQAQQKNPLIDHINEGKKSYLKYADPNDHKKIKNSKNPKEYNIGDTKIFWRWDLSNMPPAWIQEPSTCRGIGEHSYVFVADGEWNITMDQDDVNEVLFRLEDETLNSAEYGIVEMDTMFFGPVPDELDNDPKVIFFFSALGSFQGTVFDGYFSAYNQMTEAEAQQEGAHSNECEMLYMSCDPVNPVAASTLSVLSHELEHLIHWGFDTDEETWVDEGCAELAMVLYGYPDPIVNFPSNPNNNLIVWDQQFSDYVQTMLFFTYFSEQYGNEIIKQTVADQGNGTEGINNVLSNNGITEVFKDIFNNWIIANYLDDTEFEDGIYGYESLNLPVFASNSVNALPFNDSEIINDCAAEYYDIPTEFTEILIQVSSDSQEDSKLHLLAYEDDMISEIISDDDGDLILSYSQPGTYTLSKLVLAVVNQRTSSSTMNFGISILDPFVSISNIKENSLEIFPNPANDILNINAGQELNGDVNIIMHDCAGKEVMNLRYSTGNNSLMNIDISELESGLYILVISSENKIKTTKFIKP